LYTYDSILRLHDVQLRQLQNNPSAPSVKSSAKRNPENPMDYVKYGALGEAFQLQDCPAVVLIDEIDKADIDFPNDLLSVLDKDGEFHIAECDGPAVKAKYPPIVIITSNKEKGNLPAPFLRRCVYFYIGFPEAEAQRMAWLKNIIATHYQAHANPPSDELVDAACERFWAVRDVGDPYKKPSTSEFLDWLEALRGFADAAQSKSWASVAEMVETLKQRDGKLPYPELLFKIQEDWRHAARA
jgi:MoxR-like ATPase